MAWAISARRTDVRVETGEDEEVEPRVYDPTAEVQVGEDRTEIGQHPKQAEGPIAQTGAHAVQRQQGDGATDGIRQPRGEFTHPEDLHAQRLHPHEQGRLLVEGLEGDAGLERVAGHEHFPGDLREVDLVPIEEVHCTEAGHEEEQSECCDEELRVRALQHALFWSASKIRILLSADQLAQCALEAIALAKLALAHMYGTDPELVFTQSVIKKRSIHGFKSARVQGFEPRALALLHPSTHHG
jgi:hypothetical protein